MFWENKVKSKSKSKHSLMNRHRALKMVNCGEVFWQIIHWENLNFDIEVKRQKNKYTMKADLTIRQGVWNTL